MDQNRKLALYVSYYLSRFNRDALANLGYSNWGTAFKDIGIKLNVKSNSVKNWRDEFDPMFQFRVGWYQRPMSKTRVQVVRALENLDEYQIRMIVIDILSGEIDKDEDGKEQLLDLISDNDLKGFNGQYIPRGITGRRAEQYFIDYYEITKKPLVGYLNDYRDSGVGYDFKIEAGNNYALIEVKGVSGENGGILFTNKEWITACREKENYYLVVVSNLNETPILKIINNPSNKVVPNKKIYTSVEINWLVSEKDLKTI